jgi:hypothetical protein
VSRNVENNIEGLPNRQAFFVFRRHFAAFRRDVSSRCRARHRIANPAIAEVRKPPSR